MRDVLRVLDIDRAGPDKHKGKASTRSGQGDPDQHKARGLDRSQRRRRAAEDQHGTGSGAGPEKDRDDAGAENRARMNSAGQDQRKD